MPLNHLAVGAEAPPRHRSWTSFDALLYAIAVGAGADGTDDELAFTTENSSGVQQQVLPTFAVLLGGPSLSEFPELGPIDRTAVVHGEQAITLHSVLPPSGSCQSRSRLAAIHDKGSGAVVELVSDATDLETGQPLFSVRSAAFIKGAGGWTTDGGAPGPGWTLPDRSADEVRAMPTQANQALLYRLCGDRNPLHSDPSFARRAGFPRPILHGLCTFGFVGRALLAGPARGEPRNLRSMSARFARPVLPGAVLSVSMWVMADGEVYFIAADDSGQVVLDRGVAEVTPPEA
jgi:acyl dehydratase